MGAVIVEDGCIRAQERFVGRGPGRAGILDFSRDMEPAILKWL
jgi:hypothetical protein